MSRIYKERYNGELWERNYRFEAHNITKGLPNVCKHIRIYPKGKEKIKATQITWQRHNPEWDKYNIHNRPNYLRYSWISEDVTTLRLPWEEECAESNLEIIRRAVKKTLREPQTTFKEHLDETIDNYFKQPTLKNDAVLSELRLIKNSLERLTLLEGRGV